MTSAEISREYHQAAVKLAAIIDQMEQMEKRFKFIQEQNPDNGDPWFAIVIYEDEYGKEGKEGDAE